MIVYLLLGFFIGLTVCGLFHQYIDPFFQLYKQVREFKATDDASWWNLQTMKDSADFYREYPEMCKEEELPELQSAVGFEFFHPEEEYYDLEEDSKNKKYKI